MSEFMLNITTMAYRGRGVGRHEGKVVFVSRVIPGETVRVRLLRSCRNYDEAELISVEEASPSRCEPACPYADRCPGCCYQHMAYATELDIKADQLRDFLKRTPNVSPEAWQAPVPAPQSLHYRNKTVLHAGISENRLRLGYIGADNHALVPVDHCALALPEINEAIPRVLESMEGLEEGARVFFRHSTDRGVLSWKSGHPPAERLIEHTPAGMIGVPAGGFYQVNRPVAALLLHDVMQQIRSLQPNSVVDVYCGCGIFALAAAVCGVRQVAGVDRDAESIRLAQQNAAALNVSFARFVAASADRGIRQVCDLFDNGDALWVVDPPRQGLDARTVELLLKYRPRYLLYISCAPDTLARDLARLCASAYRLERVKLFDMFPRTYGFETMVLLSSGHSR